MPEVERGGRAEAGGDPRGDAAHILLDQGHGRRAEGPHGAAHHGALRNHVVSVAAVDLGDADDGGVGRLDVARDDRLQRRRDVRRDQHRIDARLGPRAMRALAGDRDVEYGAARHHGAAADLEPADRQAGPIVHAEHRVAREALEQAVLDHGVGAAETLLGGLEDEGDRAVELPRLGEVARGAEQHRGVPVVAAGVHAPVVARAMVEAVGLEDGQRIHVGAQPDRAVRVADAQHADHAGLADPAMHLDAELGELRRDQVGRALLLEAELGMGVDVAPPGGQLVVELLDARDHGHGRSPERGGAVCRMAPRLAIAGAAGASLPGLRALPALLV
jgi:hypothetical protein